jgi:zinc transport system substrate-binding protein
MKMKFKLITTLLALSILLNACNEPAPAQSPEAKATDTLNITVSILPQKYFVEQIGGEFTTINVMVEPGASPATYEPHPEQMTALAAADAYISIGVPFEKAWLEKFQAANPQMKMIDTTQNIERNATSDGGFDPHIWLSPRLVKIQSQTIYTALVELDPDHKDIFKANLDAFYAEIDKLDADIRAILEKTATRKFIVFHPAWGYFAKDYQLQQIPIEIGGQEPSAQELAAIIKLAQKEKIKVVFVQPEFSQEDAQTIAKEIDGVVLPISPLAPDWLNNLKNVAQTFAETLD